MQLLRVFGLYLAFNNNDFIINLISSIGIRNMEDFLFVILIRLKKKGMYININVALYNISEKAFLSTKRFTKYCILVSILFSVNSENIH